jgi:hypothetical protein
MFIRKKGKYYSVVEGIRHNGKVKQTTVAYLGLHPTVEAAYQFHLKESRRRDNYATDFVMLDSQRAYHKEQAAKLEELRDLKAFAKDRAEQRAEQKARETRLCGLYPDVPLDDARVLDACLSNGYGFTKALRKKYPTYAARYDEQVRREQEQVKAYKAAQRVKNQTTDQPRWGQVEWAKDVLGIGHNTTADAIKAAWRTKARQFHPDVNPSPEAAAMMSRVNQAYAVLSPKAQTI